MLIAAKCSMLFAHSVLPLACAGTSAHEPHAARVTGANLSRGRSRRRLARGVHGAPGLTWGQVQRPVKSRQAVLGAASALAGVNARRERCTEHSSDERRGASRSGGSDAHTKWKCSRGHTGRATDAPNAASGRGDLVERAPFPRSDFKRVHKGATTAYAESKRDGKLRTSGFKPEQIATNGA